MGRVLLLLIWLSFGSSLYAQGWPGVSIPTRDDLMAAGAVPYRGAGSMYVPQQKGEEALVLDSVVTVYSTEGELKRRIFTFDPLGAGHFENFTLPTEYRRELFEKNQLPPLPDFVLAWGVGWQSSAREWLEAVAGRHDFTGTYGFFAPRVSQDNTTLARYQGGRSRHPGSWGGFTLASETDPRYSVSVTLDQIDAAGPDVPFALHSVSLVFNPKNPSPGSRPLFPIPETATLDEERRSALALSAILMGQNNERHESLNPAPWRTDPSADLKVLSRDWGINSREDLVEMLTTLDQGLHGKVYQDLSELLDAHPGVEPSRLAETLRLTPRRASYLLFVAATRDDLGPEGIRAWDEGRRVALARWGYSVGFLTQGDAWDVLLSTWRKLAGRYKSWNDYYYHYIAGRAFWATGFENDLNKTNAALTEWAELSWNPIGAWNLPWPGAEDLATPDHDPWTYLYDPGPQAHSLFDVIAAGEYSATKPENEKPAQSRLDSARRRTPAFHLVTSAQISLLLRFSKVNKALALARSAAAERPELARAWSDLGEAAEAAGIAEESAASFARAVDMDPTFFDALFGAGRLRLMASDWTGALSLLERALTATPTPQPDEDGNYFYQLVFAQNRTGRFQDALPTVETLLKLYPVAAVQFEAGVCYYSLGKNWWPQARQAFLAAEKGGRTLPEFIRRWLEEG